MGAIESEMRGMFIRDGLIYAGFGALFTALLGILNPGEEVIVPTVGKACWGRGHFVCVREFYEAIKSGGEVPVTLASAARTMRILFALYCSNGERIPLTNC